MAATAILRVGLMAGRWGRVQTERDLHGELMCAALRCAAAFDVVDLHRPVMAGPMAIEHIRRGESGENARGLDHCAHGGCEGRPTAAGAGGQG